LHTQSRRCWLCAPAVVLPQEQRYQWEYVYGALEVVEGLAQFRFLPWVSLELSRGFLQQIADSARKPSMWSSGIRPGFILPEDAQLQHGFVPIGSSPFMIGAQPVVGHSFRKFYGPRGFPTSLPEFQKVFPSDTACADYLEKLRWPNGFVCPIVMDWRALPI